MKKYKNYLVSLAILGILLMPVFAFAEDLDVGANYASNIGLGDKDPREIAASVINVSLGFLSIVAVIIILFGGFKWMTAAGNDDKVDEAKKLITAGIIGLIIILAAWGIAKFVIDKLLNITNANVSW